MDYYENWESQSIYITPSLYWYNVNQLVNNLHEIRSCIISGTNNSSNDMKTKSRLLSLLSQLQQIQQTVPATRTTRFPNDTTFLCEGISNWHVDLDLLSLALNSMTLEEKKGKKRQLLGFETMGQVEMFAIEKINLILTSIAGDQNNNLITRQRFEQELYGLNWVERREFVLFLGYKVLLDKDNYKITSLVVARFLKRVDKILHQII